MSTPQTTAGKAATLCYGIVGCAGGILFFNLFLERIISFLALVLRSYHMWRLRANKNSSNSNSSERQDSGDYGSDVDSLESYKPSVYWVMIYMFLGACIIACVGSAMYAFMEGWSYFESLYFCFVAFTTIGFGDFVSSQKPEYEMQLLYRIGNFLCIVLGSSCVYSLLNVISIVIKQFLNWMIKKLECPRCRPQKPPPIASRQRRNAIAPSMARESNGSRHDRSEHSKRVIVIDDESAMYDSDGNSRRNSGEMISMQQMLGLNKLTLAMMQKQLYETANRNFIDPEHHPSGGLSGGIGPLAILNEKLGEEV